MINVIFEAPENAGIDNLTDESLSFFTELIPSALVKRLTDLYVLILGKNYLFLLKYYKLLR
jgi:hypothetical protein